MCSLSDDLQVYLTEEEKGWLSADSDIFYAHFSNRAPQDAQEKILRRLAEARTKLEAVESLNIGHIHSLTVPVPHCPRCRLDAILGGSETLEIPQEGHASFVARRKYERESE